MSEPTIAEKPYEPLTVKQWANELDGSEETECVIQAAIDEAVKPYVTARRTLANILQVLLDDGYVAMEASVDKPITNAEDVA